MDWDLQEIFIRTEAGEEERIVQAIEAMGGG